MTINAGSVTVWAANRLGVGDATQEQDDGERRRPLDHPPLSAITLDDEALTLQGTGGGAAFGALEVVAMDPSRSPDRHAGRHHACVGRNGPKIAT